MYSYGKVVKGLNVPVRPVRSILLRTEGCRSQLLGAEDHSPVTPHLLESRRLFGSRAVRLRCCTHCHCVRHMVWQPIRLLGTKLKSHPRDVKSAAKYYLLGIPNRDIVGLMVFPIDIWVSSSSRGPKSGRKA
jgi:hypothetical protein